MSRPASPRVPQIGQTVAAYTRTDPHATIFACWPALVLRVQQPGVPDSPLDLMGFSLDTGASPLHAVPYSGPDHPIFWDWLPAGGGAPQRVRLREAAVPVVEAGARHNQADQAALNAAHDAIVQAGANNCAPAQTPASEAVEAPDAPAVIVAQSVGLVAYLFAEGLVPADTAVIDRPTVEAVTGKHVYGMVPLELAVLADRVTIIPLNLPDDMQMWPTDLEEFKALAAAPRTFQVQEIAPTPPPAQEAAHPGGERRPLVEAAARVQEAQPATGFDAAKGELTLRIIQPGFNVTQSRYYTPNAVQAIAEAMRGCKQYLDHPTPAEARERPERSLDAWVSSITETWVDAGGVAWGKATITDPVFLERCKRLAETGLLAQLGASINAVGVGQKAVVEGVETFQVDGVDKSDPFRSVDWVTEPGAGGRAELLETPRGAALRRTRKLKEQSMDPNTNPAPDAGAQDDDAAQDQALAQQVADLAGRMDKLETSMGQMTEAVTGMARAHGLDTLLGQVPANEAAKAAARSKLLATTEALTLEKVREAVATEIALARSIAGVTTRVQGFGGTGDPATPPDPTKELEDYFRAQGLEGRALEVAVRGY